MAGNHIQKGSTLTLTTPYTVVSGAGMLVGSIFAIALHAAEADQPVEAKTDEAWSLPKAAGAITEGQKIYWNDATKLVTGTAAGGVLIGAAILSAAGADASVSVKLNGTVV